MSEFREYQKSSFITARPYVPGESLERVSVSPHDIDKGHPMDGDMIACDPNNTDDQWLVSCNYFHNNYALRDGSEKKDAEIARLQHRVAELEEEIYNAVNLLDGAVCPSPHHRVGVEENDCEWCFHRHTVVSQLKGVEAKSAGVDDGNSN